MGLFKYRQGIRYMMQLLIIKLVFCLGWLSAIAVGQLELSESISGSVSFPDLVITCVGNLAVFYSSILRGGLYLEMGAKDVLTFLTGGIKMKKIKGWQKNSIGFGLTTCNQEDLSDCSVVMLSQKTPNSSMTQFAEYIANVHHVRSVLLQYFPLQSDYIQSLPLTLDSICNWQYRECKCILFWTREDVTVMVAEQIPGTLKRLSHALCLLPSLDCLKHGCHGCNEGLLHVEKIEAYEIGTRNHGLSHVGEIEDYEIGTMNHGLSNVEETHDERRVMWRRLRLMWRRLRLMMMRLRLMMMRRPVMEETNVDEVEETEVNEFGTKKKRLREGEPKVECSAAVCGSPYSLILDVPDVPATCICVPVPHEVNSKTTDLWTELLIGSFKSKDFETRRDLIRLEISSVSHDLQNHVDRSGKCYAVEEFNIASLIVPRLTEILINLGLTFWFKVDGFSSALVARRAVRDYIVDNTRRGFASHVFMNKAEVRSNEDNTNACQVLSFRDNVWSPRALSVIVGLVNLSCSISWAVLVSLEGDANKWYHTHSMAPSKGRLLSIFVGIAIALAMDCVDLYLYFPNPRSSIKRWFHCRTKTNEEKQRDEAQERLDRARKPDRKEKSDHRRRKIIIVCTMIVFQISCIVSSSLVARAVGIKSFHRWVYGAVQGLVWLKWGIGSYLLGQYIPRERSGAALTYGSTGIYMYSSAFWLNAILAGARAKWEFF